MAAIGLKTQIWNNNARSIALLALYPAFMLALVWAIALVLSWAASGPGSDFTRASTAAGAVINEYWPLIVSSIVLWFLVAWRFNTSMIRALSHAHAVERRDEPELYNMLENMCISRGARMPRLEIIETHGRNAFASGVSDRDYTITITRGLLTTLKPDEVEAVLGHELSHILHRDVRLLMVCVVFTGMIGFAAQIVWSLARSNIRVTSGRGRGSGGILLMIYGILMVGYLASLMARFTLSRAREYMADAGSVELTRNPEAMMRALLRISGRDQVPGMTGDVALMCIENTRPFLGLFSTHPPITRRVEAISRVTGVPVPALSPHSPAEAAERFQRPGDRHPDWLTLGQGQSNPWKR